jgi:hypothetical protein
MEIPVNRNNTFENEEVSDTFLDQYNKEIDEAEVEIDSGNYLDQDEVEKLMTDRRKNQRV